MTDQEQREEFFNKIDQDIAKYGLSVMVVVAEKREISWMYTIGLTEHALPEIILSSNSPIVFHRSINQIALEAMVKTLVLEAGPLTEIPLMLRDGTPQRVALRKVTNYGTIRNDLALQTEYRYAGKSDYLQLIWADANNILPDEPGYDFVGCPQELY